MTKSHIARLLTLLISTVALITLLPLQFQPLIAQSESPLPTPTPRPSVGDFPEGEKIALEHVSKVLNLPVDQLFVGNPIIAQYPHSKKVVWEASVNSKDGKQSEIVTIDVTTRGVVDRKALRKDDEDIRKNTYGKADPALHKRLKELKDEELVTISVVYKMDLDTETIRQQIVDRYPQAKLLGFRPSEETDLQLYDQIFAEIMAAEAKAYEQRANVIIPQITEYGVRVKAILPIAPILHIEGTKQQIHKLLKNDDLVQAYLGEPLTPLMNSTASTLRTPAVWQRGITGSGVKVAVVEREGIYFAHSFLTDGTYYQSSPVIDNGHATMVAGIIASTHPQYRGVAYGAPALYSANQNSDSVSAAESAMNGAVNANSNVLNLSQGQAGGVLSDFGKFNDYIVSNYYRTIVSGSGNLGGSVYNPAIGYNVIAVGGISDLDTPVWSDDVMWSDYPLSSGYVNPSDGREKPEVVADADSVITTNLSNGFSVPCALFGIAWCGVGTSGATAQVSSLAALLMERKPILKTWPDGVKAVIMASAVHDVDLDNSEGGNVSISDEDGVGAIDAALADAVLQNNWYQLDWMSSGTGFAEKVYSMPVTMGERVRVVLTWLSHGSLGPPRTDVLETNLNLRIEEPSGALYGSSTSSVDNVEVFEFIAAVSGTYNVKVQRPAGSTITESFALAWSRQGTYLPDVRRAKSETTGTWNRNIYIRSDEAVQQIVQMYSMQRDGNFNKLDTAYLDPGSQWVNPVSNTSYEGNAILSGSEDLGAIATIERTTGNASRGAYSAFDSLIVSSKFYLPLVQRLATTASGTANSEIVVQNTSGFNINVDLQMIDPSGVVRYTKNVTINAGGSYRYQLKDEMAANLPNGWYGAAVVNVNTANGKAAVIGHLFAGTDTLQTYDAFPNEALTAEWVIPLFASRLTNGLSTPVGIQNLGGADIPANKLQLSCKKDPASGGSDFIKLYSTAIPNNTAVYFNPVTDLTLPNNWYGACRVKVLDNPNAKIVSFVQMRSTACSGCSPTNLTNAAAYEAIPANSQTRTLVFPIVQKRLSDGSATAITIQNLSTTSSTNVQFFYVRNCSPCSNSVVGPYSIPAGGSIVHNHRLSGTGTGTGLHNLPDGWTGSVVVISQDQPIGGFAQLTNYTNPPLGDTLMAHTAVAR